MFSTRVTGAEETILRGEARGCRHFPGWLPCGEDEQSIRDKLGWDADDAKNLGHQSSQSVDDTSSGED